MPLKMLMSFGVNCNAGQGTCLRFPINIFGNNTLFGISTDCLSAENYFKYSVTSLMQSRGVFINKSIYYNEISNLPDTIAL